MTTTISKRYRFCASHRLHTAELSVAENQRVFGKCNNPYGHGHDYVLDVAVTGEVDAETGLIVRLADLDALVAEEVLASFAHRSLNADVMEFGELVATTENVALVIANRLRRKWADYFPYPQARISGIFIQETDRNSFEVLVPEADEQAGRQRAELNESVIVNA